MTTSSYTTYHAIDDALAQYYQRLGYFHYYNTDNGLFSTYIKLYTEFDRLHVEDELKHPYDPINYSYLWLYFDTNFPTPQYATTLKPHQSEAFKFYIVQYCYEFNKPPSDEYIANVLLPKCNAYGEIATYGAYKFDKEAKEKCIDEIVDGALQQYVPADSCIFDISDMELKLNLFVHKWNNNPNKTRTLNLEAVKILLVSIHTNGRLDFIQLAKNFNIPACAAMHLWLIVNQILENSSMTYASSDEDWSPSLCSGINQDDISDVDSDGIYEEEDTGDNTEYIHNQCEFSSCVTSRRIMHQIHYDKWDVNSSTVADLYYNRWVLPTQMQQLRTRMNDYQSQLDGIIIKNIFEQAFALYVLCMYYIYFPKTKKN